MGDVLIAALEAALAVLKASPPARPVPDDLLTIKEAALELGGPAHPLDPSTVSRMLKRQLLEGIGEGKRTRIFRSSIEALKSQRRSA